VPGPLSVSPFLSRYIGPFLFALPLYRSLAFFLPLSSFRGENCFFFRYIFLLPAEFCFSGNIAIFSFPEISALKKLFPPCMRRFSVSSLIEKTFFFSGRPPASPEKGTFPIQDCFRFSFLPQLERRFFPKNQALLSTASSCTKRFSSPG